MAKFRPVDNDNPACVAVVTTEVDIVSFRADAGWVEIEEEEVPVKKTVKKAKDETVVSGE